MSALGPTADHAEIRLWAAKHNAIAAEMLPHILDGEPAVLRLITAADAKQCLDIRLISWEEFFVKFDELGLRFVYDDTSSRNEILQGDGTVGHPALHRRKE